MRFGNGSFKRNQGPSMFLKMEEGVNYDGFIVGDIVEFSKSFNGKPPVKRFKFNFVIKENGAWVSKILECGYSITDQIEALVEAGYIVEEYQFRISKTGEKMATKYSVIALPKKIDDLTKHTISNVQLKSLEGKEEKAMTGSDSPSYDPDGLPY